MRARPQAHGAIRIELDDVDDWKLLSRLLLDAHDPEYDLAADVAGRISDEEVAEDWREFVLPDLRDEFDGGLRRVTEAIERAFADCHGGAGSLEIARDAAHDWYGVINRARLALEARYQFAGEKPGPHMPPDVRAARLRDRLYCALQSLILDHAFE